MRFTRIYYSFGALASLFLCGCATTAFVDSTMPTKVSFVYFVPESFWMTETSLRVKGTALRYSSDDEGPELIAEYLIDQATGLPTRDPVLIDDADPSEGVDVPWEFRDVKIPVAPVERSQLPDIEYSSDSSGPIIIFDEFNYVGRTTENEFLANPVRTGLFVSSEGKTIIQMPEYSETSGYANMVMLVFTPATVAFDVVTFPIQAGGFILFRYALATSGR